MTSDTPKPFAHPVTGVEVQLSQSKVQSAGMKGTQFLFSRRKVDVLRAPPLGVNRQLLSIEPDLAPSNPPSPAADSPVLRMSDASEGFPCKHVPIPHGSINLSSLFGRLGPFTVFHPPKLKLTLHVLMA
jgi:hypothetical protein